MTERRPKPADLNRRAAAVVAEATGTAPEKNPHAVALGKLGGEARKKKLSEERRKQIAREANAERQRRFRARRRAEAQEAAKTA